MKKLKNKISKSKRKYFHSDTFRLVLPVSEIRKGNKSDLRKSHFESNPIDFFSVERKNKTDIYQITDRKKDRYRKLKTYNNKVQKTETKRIKLKSGKTKIVQKKIKGKRKLQQKEIIKNFQQRENKNIGITERYKRRDGYKVKREEYDKNARLSRKRGRYFQAVVLVESSYKGRVKINYGKSSRRIYSVSIKEESLLQAKNNAILINRAQLGVDYDVSTHDEVLAEKILFYSISR